MLLTKISEELQIDKEFIIKTIDNGSKNYKKFYIPKRNGMFRTIYHPSRNLKVLQYWLVNNIFNELPISAYSTAYRKGSSIKKNAQFHVNNRYFLHLDIKNFFESITRKHIILLLSNKLGLTKDDIMLICKICLFKNHLTIGSVSSPIISNCVMYKFDQEIRRNIEKEIIYTRYADDLIFSSKTYIDRNIIEIVSKLLLDHNFNLNNEKTHFMPPKGKQAVTGLVINGGKLSIGYTKHIEIKTKLYKKLKYNIGNSSEILGHLFYLKDIEPELFNKLIIKYSNFGNVIEVLKKHQQDELSTLREVAATSK